MEFEQEFVPAPMTMAKTIAMTKTMLIPMTMVTPMTMMMTAQAHMIKYLYV